MVEKRYTLVKNDRVGYLEDEVNKLLAEGWVCLGGPFTCNEFYIQAMIKESK